MNKVIILTSFCLGNLAYLAQVGASHAPDVSDDGSSDWIPAPSFVGRRRVPEAAA